MKSVVSSLIVRHISPVVFLAVAWRILDASPVLWTYDLLMGSVVSVPSLDNQTIWITGASSGIGAATVCELATARARHVVLSARRVEEMARVVKDCQLELLNGVDAGSSDISPTTTFSIVPYDALAPEKTSMVVEQAIESTPEKSIDMLILNSGIYQVEPALQTSYGYRRKLFQVNVESPIELSQSLILQDGWKERGAGHIVVVSSMMSKGPQSLSSTYAQRLPSRAIFNPYLRKNGGGCKSLMFYQEQLQRTCGAMLKVILRWMVVQEPLTKRSSLMWEDA